MISRFAPSTTGEAHPGTLLSALLVWLDARARGGRVVLRLEDLDVTRTKAELGRRSCSRRCGWLGLDWDEVGRPERSAAARTRPRSTGSRPPAGSIRARAAAPIAPAAAARPTVAGPTTNTCRGARSPASWRDADRGRAACGSTTIASTLVDDGRPRSVADAGADMGDPIVRRRDGVIAYQLAVVVDDAAAGITDVIRGRDIAPSTATQVLIAARCSACRRRATAITSCCSSRSGDKLAKLHGSMPFSKLRARYTGAELRALLAVAAGQPPDVTPATFDWARVPAHDRVARWTDGLAIE